jgi:peroxiredoxin
MNPTLRKTTSAFLLSAAFTLNALAEEPKQAAVGDRVPDVTLRTAESTDLKLRDAVKSKPAVLIFYRGGWCPFCTRHLMALAEVEKDLTAAGYQILAISPDQPAKLAETPDRDKLSYTLLSDSDVAAAKAFGITFKVPDELVTKYKTEYQIDLEGASGKTHHLLPHPAVFIVDQAGIIRFAHVNPDYKVRLDPAEILKTVREMKPAATP